MDGGATPMRPTFDFRGIAHRASEAVGSPVAFGLAVGTIATWAMTGPLFRFSDTWQLVINTGTTVVTFLMVFLIQNTQNREAKATQLKLDELIRVMHAARNQLVDIEDASEQELRDLQQEFGAVRRAAVLMPRTQLVIHQRSVRRRCKGGNNEPPKRP